MKGNRIGVSVELLFRDSKLASTQVVFTTSYQYRQEGMSLRCQSHYPKAPGKRGRSCRTCINYEIYRCLSGPFLADAALVTQELVTPRYRATSAPEYPNSLTASQDMTWRASTIACLRLPDRSSPRPMWWI